MHIDNNKTYTKYFTISTHHLIHSTCIWGFPDSSAGNLGLISGDIWVWSLGWAGSEEKGMAAHSSILAWRIPWTEESGRLQSMGSQRVEHNWAMSTFTFITCTKVSGKTEAYLILTGIMWAECCSYSHSVDSGVYRQRPILSLITHTHTHMHRNIYTHTNS